MADTSRNAAMKLGQLSILLLLLGLQGCDLVSGDDGFVQGPPSLLRNGSFELWQDSLPSYWNLVAPSPSWCQPMNETPPGGGDYSVYLFRLPTLRPQELWQSVTVADSASDVRLSFWAEGSHGPVYFRLKTSTMIYTSDTLFNFYQMSGWYQYSTNLSRSVHEGDSITVVLSSWGMYDLVSLTLVN